MKLINWNIGSVKSAMDNKTTRGQQSNAVLRQIAELNPDLIGLQETKIPENGMPTKVSQRLATMFPRYFQVINPSRSPARTSYSGTLYLIKGSLAPKVSKPRLGVSDVVDAQGRIITLEFPDFFVSNVYTPHYEVHLTNHDLHQKWNRAVVRYLAKLQQRKPVIAAGDFIVWHDLNDQLNTSQRRLIQSQNELLTWYQNAGLVDALSIKNSNDPTKLYSWWAPNITKRQERGFRTDYWFISSKLVGSVVDTNVINTGKRRDHAPILLQLDN